MHALATNLHMLLLAIPQLEEDGVSDKSSPAVLTHRSALNAYVYFLTALYERSCKRRAQQPAEPAGGTAYLQHLT